MDQFKGRLVKLLRWSERYAKTDMVYLFQGGFWLTLGQLIASASAFVLAIAFANLFPKETYGTYKYVLTAVGVLTIPTLRYMNVAITQSVAQGKEGTALAAIKTKIIWGLLGGLGAAAVGTYYFLNDNETLGVLFTICAPFVPFKDSLSAYVAILNGKRDFKRATLFSSIPTVLGMGTMVAILFLTRSIYWVLLAYFVFWTTTNFLLLRRTLRVHQLNDSIDQKSITYGKQVSLIGVLAAVAGYFDKLIIFHFLGAASLAVYSIALAPISQISGVMGNINTLATPKFSKQDTPSLKSSLKIKERRITFIVAFVSLAYILASRFLFELLFPKYEEAIFFSQVIAVSIPLTIIVRFRLTAIQSRFNRKASYIYTSLVSVIQIILNFVGVYFYGLVGIVASYVAISVCQFIITWIIVKKL